MSERREAVRKAYQEALTRAKKEAEGHG